MVRGPAPEPTAADRVRSGAEKAGRVLGAVMVLQTMRDQSNIAQRLQSGDMNAVQALVGTTRNVEGVSVGFTASRNWLVSLLVIVTGNPDPEMTAPARVT